MRVIRFAVLVCVGLWSAAAPVRADEAAALAALRQGGHVALMRHTDAPGPSGDPAGFRLDDCATQRNLSDRGRTEAGAAGARLKRDQARITRIVSSPWCRCLDTARLLDLGTVETEEAFSNAFVLSSRRDDLAKAARAVIDAWKGDGTLLVVTHGANILALTGHSPASGEIVVVAPGGSGRLRQIGRLPVPPR